MSDNKIEINFSILDNLHNFEHYTYMTQTVIKALFINTVNYASDNWSRFYNQNASKTPEIRHFRGFLMPKIADTVCPNLNGFGVI